MAGNVEFLEALNGTLTDPVAQSGDMPVNLRDAADVYQTSQVYTKTEVESGTMTFANKSLVDATTFFIDETDGSKKLQFQISGFTTATVRTWTVPNVSDTFVGVSAAQTLINKILTTPVINGLNGTGVFAFGGASGPGTIEMGRQDGTAATTFIDMHTSVAVVDYNVRIQASGDVGLGLGTLNILAGSAQLNGSNFLTALTGQPLDADLTALAALASTGLISRTGSGTVAARAILGTTNQVVVSNGDGVSGNPTLSVGTDLAAIAAAGVGILSNYLSGFTLANSGVDAVNDIDIVAGVCMDSTNAAFMSLAATTKRLDAAWAVGSGNGGLDTGSIANTTYHVYAIKRLDTGVVDAIFSASASAPTLPTNYTVYRRIGSIIRSGATILAFKQLGDRFLLADPVNDIDVATQGTTAVTRALTVPIGIQFTTMLRVRGSNAAGWAMLITALDTTDTDPATTRSTVGGAAGEADLMTVDVRTNTSGQVRSRSTTASTDLKITTYGWIDTRGRL